MSNTSQNPVDAEAIERAKKIASGPLGQQVGRYPMRFAAPLALTKVGDGSREVVLSNGTATLVDLGQGPLIITAGHVISRYLERSKTHQSHLRVGNLNLHNWQERIIGLNEALDLATISLRLTELPLINPFSNAEEIAKELCKPRCWPPGEIKAGDWIVVGGFPGALRLWQRPNDFSFGSFNGGPFQVNAASSGKLVCHFDREACIVSGEMGPDFRALGGVSGGPVFHYRDRSIDPFELVGVIFEYGENFDTMLIRHLKFVQPDGSVRESMPDSEGMS